MASKTTALFLTFATLLAACGGGSDSADQATTDIVASDEADDETPAVTTTTIASSTTTTIEEVAFRDDTDAEPGIVYDIGRVAGVFTDGAGLAFIEYDRAQVVVGGRLMSGQGLTQEVILVESAAGLKNENSRLRTYPLADDVQVQITNPSFIASNCEGGRDQINFVSTSLDQVEFEGSWAQPASLTFNAAGEVSGVKFMVVCGTDAPAPAAGASDAEPGLIYDIGQIATAEVEEGPEDQDGTTVITFNRYEAITATGETVGAPSLTGEVIYTPSTDFPFADAVPTLLSYPVSPTAEFLEVDPVWFAGQDALCGGDSSEAGNPIRWTATSLQGAGSPLASLTFDGSGTVIRIRYMLGC
jgi:hypothetical protein